MKTISIRLEDSIYEELTKNYLTKQEVNFDGVKFFL